MFMTVLLSLILPVLAGGGVVALCWLLPPLRKWSWLSGAAFGLALAVGVLASFISDSGLPSFPPGKRWEWLGIMAMVAGLLALIMPITGQPGQQRSWPLMELVAVLVGAMVAKLPLLAAWADGKSLEDAVPFFVDMTWADQVALGLGIALSILIFDRVVANRHGELACLEGREHTR